MIKLCSYAGLKPAIKIRFKLCYSAGLMPTINIRFKLCYYAALKQNIKALLKLSGFMMRVLHFNTRSVMFIFRIIVIIDFLSCNLKVYNVHVTSKTR